jgi:hypothetical protein
MAALNPIIGVAPLAIAKAHERGIETRETVIPDPKFSLTLVLIDFGLPTSANPLSTFYKFFSYIIMFNID